MNHFTFVVMLITNQYDSIFILNMSDIQFIVVIIIIYTKNTLGYIHFYLDFRISGMYICIKLKSFKLKLIP